MSRDTAEQDYHKRPVGKIIKISGTVIDVQFPQGKTPKINTELLVELPELDEKKRSIKFVRTPKFEEVPYPVVMEPNLVIEYYSR